jgi:ComF family protein
MPYFGVQSPSVQQHKMAISRPYGLPPQSLHQLLFSFFKEVAHANSAWLVLAMPNATCPEPMGDLLSVYARAHAPCLRVPTVRFTCHNPNIPCGRCLQKPPPWSALVAVTDYVPPLSGLIHQFKFSRQSTLAIPLARVLLLAILQARRTRTLPHADCIVNVPLHARRHWRRGYNQSDLLCRPLAHWLGCRYPASALKRVHATAIQHPVDRLRKRTLKMPFALNSR